MLLARRVVSRSGSWARIGRDIVAPLQRFALAGFYVVLLTATYYLAVRLGLGFRFQNSQIGVVWPANAVLLSALLLTPTGRWWVVLVVTALAHIAVMGPVIPPWRWSWQIVGNAVFAVATVALLRRFAGLPLHFGSRRQVLAYMMVAFVTPALFAFTTPAFVRSLFKLEATNHASTALLRTTLSNATALLLVAPTVLVWGAYGVRRLKEVPSARLCEAALVMMSLLTVGIIAFGTGPEIARLPTLLLWIFPPLLWAAVRFGPVGANTSLFCIAGLSMWGTARQLGPFVLMTEADQVLSLQLFWIVLCAPVMLLAAVIREREQVEAALHDRTNQLAHVTRMATVGELSGALAHELRQPLTAILANAQAAAHLLSSQSVDLQELREILDDIAQQDQQAANVIARLRTFLKKGESRFESLALEAVVRDALALCRSVLAISAVDVQTQVASGLPHVRGDAVQLLQVVLNLIVNACESMRELPMRNRHLGLQVARGGADGVEVQVVDCGSGLPPGSDDRVFEAFFTTKEHGLGLGLAISRSITTAHGGRLWAENNPHGGATFHLMIPAEKTTAAPFSDDRRN